MALKVMSRNKTSKENFLLEFSMSFLLSSNPHIIGCYGTAFKTREHFVFAQELAPAGDLLSLIVQNVGLPEEAVKRCAVQISSALEFMAEKGLVHMDIKPDNVLVFDEECRCVKLTDFGLTRSKGTVITNKIGTVYYMAPEMCDVMVSEALVVDFTLDVWAFGVVLLCLLTGEMPWEEAVEGDNNYSRFLYWQLYFQEDEPPEPWNKLSTAALKMLNTLMAIDYKKRSPATDILKYLNESWKKEVSKPITTQGNSNQPNNVSSKEYQCENSDPLSQLSSETESGNSSSSISSRSTMSSMSGLSTSDSSGSHHELRGDPWRSHTPIIVDEHVSLAIGAEEEVG